MPTKNKEMRFAPRVNLEYREQSNTVEIFIFDYIATPDFAFPGEVTSEPIVRELGEHPDAEQIIVRINSGGGAVHEAIAMHAALVRHQAPVHVFIEGLAASAATIVAMAGGKITIAAGGAMLVHPPSTVAVGGSDDMKSAGKLLDDILTSVSSIYRARTGQPAEVVDQWLKGDTWFSDKEAVEAGLADEVGPRSKMVAALNSSGLGRTVAQEVEDKLRVRTKVKAKNMPTDKTSETPKAATIGELKGAFPDHPQFVVDQAEAGATLTEARGKFAEVLANEQRVVLQAKDGEIAQLKESLGQKDEKIAELEARLGKLAKAGHNGAINADGLGDEPETNSRDDEAKPAVSNDAIAATLNRLGYSAN